MAKGLSYVLFTVLSPKTKYNIGILEVLNKDFFNERMNKGTDYSVDWEKHFFTCNKSTKQIS